MPQLQVLEELQHQTDFVERQADDIDQIGDRDDDLQAELAAAQHAGNLAVLVLGAAIDFVGDQHRSAVFQTPHRPRVRQLAILFGHAFGKDLLGALGQLELVGGGEPAASTFA